MKMNWGVFIEWKMRKKNKNIITKSWFETWLSDYIEAGGWDEALGSAPAIVDDSPEVSALIHHVV